jgi:putative ABC transport system permease protein
MNPPIELDNWQLLTACALLLVCLAASRVWQLGLEAEFAIATLRSVVQLLALGFVLAWVFDNANVWLVLSVMAAFIGISSWTAVSRMGTPVPGLLLNTGIALSAGAALVTLLTALLVIGVRPWWTPQYMIPLAGMIIANAMNASALAIERLRSELSTRRGEVEELLALGASSRQAIQPLVRVSLRAALRPTLNSMYVVGIVAIPGTMTGQLLAGLPPDGAARYQILVMLLWAAGSAASSALLMSLSYKRFFTPALQLRHELLDRP